MIIGLILHILLGLFLSAMLWFFGLGGMTAWFHGGSTGWLNSSAGACTILAIGALTGWASYIFRDHDIIARSPENAERFRVARIVFLAVVSALSALLVLMLRKA